MEINITSIKHIYDCLSDNYSKELFSNRLMYSMTSDEKYISNIVHMTDEGKEFYSKISDAKDNGFIAFGAGIWGRSIVKFYSNINWKGFVDNYQPSGTIFENIPIYTFDEFINEYQGESIVITTRLYCTEIYNQLISAGIKEEKIINAGKMIDEMSQRQYFDLEELPHNKKEIFVDGGGFDGKTSLIFRKWCGNNENFSWIFEADKENFSKCEENLKDNFENAKIFPYALWSENIELNFESKGTGSSKVNSSGSEKIIAKSMDSILKNQPVTFIKMDIEGAELQAIKGAENIIRSMRPKLAISIYHKPEDVWEIPELLLQYNPNYRLYLRHYTIVEAETVLYAI